MSDPAKTDASLEPDARFEEPLRRVAFEPGMLLGVEATRAEQDYHRRRLNRHQYWLHGAGTVCGLAVRATGDAGADPDASVRVRLEVSPGIGIDGLGRELSVHEPYCIDLRAWLEARAQDPARFAALIRDGYHEPSNSLWLRVTMRHQDCASGLQPVLAAKVNAGTDPVQPSRIRDGVLLELSPELPAPDPSIDAPPAAEPYRPWPAHASVPPEVAGKLTDAELAFLGAHTGGARRQLELHSRLLHALPDDSTALEVRAELEEAARTLLARIRVDLGPDRAVIVHPSRITVNNLFRRFVTTADQLALLGRSP